jgi:hypothetical protein
MRKSLILTGTFAVFFMVIPTLAQQQSGLAPGAASAASTNSAAHREDYDPLLDLPPLPKNRVTLIGGTVANLDEVMNRVVVQPFGSKQKMQIRFDTRTRFFRDGQPITVRDIHQAQRVYVDTMLNGSRIFAKTIWIQTKVESGVGHGQVLDIDLQHNTVTVRDQLSEQPLRFRITPATTVRRGDQAGTVSDLVQGALVTLNFSPQRELSEITVLARPGSAFTFAGRVTYLDLSRKMLAVENQSDRNSYDIYMDTIPESISRQLREGMNVSISTVFDGSRYSARQIDMGSANTAQQNH